jgi:hypothetical protein
MNTRLPPDVAANADFVMDCDGWEAEGGAPASRGSVASAPTADRLLLQCLGTAVVGEWNKLPMPLRRVIYARAVDGSASGLKRRMARLLHDHMRPVSLQGSWADSE